jgi:hypothetical protein
LQHINCYRELHFRESETNIQNLDPRIKFI